MNSQINGSTAYHILHFSNLIRNAWQKKHDYLLNTDDFFIPIHNWNIFQLRSIFSIFFFQLKYRLADWKQQWFHLFFLVEMMFCIQLFFVDKQPIIFKADFSINVWRKRKSILVLHLVSNHLKWMLRLENKKKYHYNFGFSFWKWDFFFFVNWRRRIFTIGNFPDMKILSGPFFYLHYFYLWTHQGCRSLLKCGGAWGNLGVPNAHTS